MQSESTAIREKYVTVLKGTVGSGGSLVPIVDGKLERDLVPQSDRFVKVTDTTEEGRNNKTLRISLVTVEVEINVITQSAVSTDLVEEMEDAVLQSILPSPVNGAIMTLDAPFTLSFVRLINRETPDVEKLEGNRFLSRKRIFFSNRITQL